MRDRVLASRVLDGVDLGTERLAVFIFDLGFSLFFICDDWGDGVDRDFPVSHCDVAIDRGYCYGWMG